MQLGVLVSAFSSPSFLPPPQQRAKDLHRLPDRRTVQLLIDTALVNAIPQAPAEPGSGGQAFGSMLGTLIWIAYFVKSSRVGNTFVVRRGKSDVAVPGVPGEAFSIGQ